MRTVQTTDRKVRLRIESVDDSRRPAAVIDADNIGEVDGYLTVGGQIVPPDAAALTDPALDGQFNALMEDARALGLLADLGRPAPREMADRLTAAVASAGSLDVGDAAMRWHDPGGMSIAHWTKGATTIGAESTGIAITGRMQSRLTIVTGPAAPDAAPDEVVVNGRRYVPAEEG